VHAHRTWDIDGCWYQAQSNKHFAASDLDAGGRPRPGWQAG